MMQATVLEEPDLTSTNDLSSAGTANDLTSHNEHTVQVSKVRSMRDIATRLTDTERIDLQWLKLEQIDPCEDSRVEGVRTASSAYLRQLPFDCLTDAGLKLLSCQLPLHVVRKRRGAKTPAAYSCVGGLRLYRLLKERLSSADTVLAIIHRDDDEEIKLLATIDLLIVPAFLGLHHKDRRPLAAAWDKAEQLGFQNMLTRNQHHALNHMLGCDIRPAKK